MDIDSKYEWAIDNTDTDMAINWEQTIVKKYLICVGQIDTKIDLLYKY